MKKTNYIVRVSDIAYSDADVSIRGTNKEILLRNAAKLARSLKTQYHWKNGINVYVKLYVVYVDQKGAAVPLPIKIMRF